MVDFTIETKQKLSDEQAHLLQDFILALEKGDDLKISILLTQLEMKGLKIVQSE